VVRGGSFNNDARNLRGAYRNNNDPDNVNDNIGFRCVVGSAGAQIHRVVPGPEFRRRDLAVGRRKRAGSVPPGRQVAGGAPAGEEEGPSDRE
jgi:hypothetical protein